MKLESDILGELNMLEGEDYWMWYDGPMIWPVEDKQGNTYMAYFFDNDLECHPETGKIVRSSVTYWIIPASRELIKDLFDGRISIRNFFFTPSKIYLHTDAGIGCESKTIEVVDITLPYYIGGIPEEKVYLFEKEENEDGKQD